MASLTQWTWVWANSRRLEGQGSLMCCSPRGCKESDMMEQLNNNNVDPYVFSSFFYNSSNTQINVTVKAGPYYCIFFCFWPHWRCEGCGALVPPPGIKPMPPALGAWSLNHWSSREVPILLLFVLLATFTECFLPNRYCGKYITHIISLNLHKP